MKPKKSPVIPPETGIAEVDLGSRELRETIRLFKELLPVGNAGQSRIFHKTMNRLIHLVARNAGREKKYLAEVGCLSSGFFDKSAMAVIEEIQKINRSLDDDFLSAENLVLLMEDWQSRHAGMFCGHIRFHQRGFLLTGEEVAK